MSVLQIAHDAIAFARASVPWKSDNKRYDPGHAKRPSPATLQERDMKLLNLRREAYPVQGCPMAEVLHYGRLVMAHGAGNCLEQCSAAAVH